MIPKEFSLILAIVIFLVSVLDDILYVFFVRRVMKGSKFTAAILSGTLTLLVSLEGYAQYAVHPAYMLANALGSTVGCPIAILIEDRLPTAPKPRNKKGQFKKIVCMAMMFKPSQPTSAFQRRERIP